MIQEIVNRNRRKVKRKIFNKTILLMQNKLRQTLYIMEERNTIYLDDISNTINRLEMELDDLKATLAILTL